MAPKKIIRATVNYIAVSSTELSFAKGDFFYVIDIKDRYYEVMNPMEKTRGLVPMAYFSNLQQKRPESIYPSVNADTRSEYSASDNKSRQSDFIAPRDTPSVAYSASRDTLSVAYSDPRNTTVPSRYTPEPTATRMAETIYSPQGYPTPGPNSPNDSPFGHPNSATPNKSSPQSHTPKSPSSYQLPGIYETSHIHNPLALPTIPNERISLKTCLSSVEVLECQLLNSAWVYTVQLVFINNTCRKFYRTMDDFMNLQVALLNKFEMEAGYSSAQRVIPFLPKQERMTLAQAHKRKSYLTFYLDQLLSLSDKLVDSAEMEIFFVPRGSEVNLERKIDSVDYSDALLDIIEEFKENSKVSITLVDAGQRYEWSVSSRILFSSLWSSVEYYSNDLTEIIYHDEAGRELILQNDLDVGLLFQLPKVELSVLK
ncbi:bud emergence protein 1 [Terramyces sp. JEL0728]|nr:bud emergence protein 1 [Terramyces sp. JEL0728]